VEMESTCGVCSGTLVGQHEDAAYFSSRFAVVWQEAACAPCACGRALARGTEAGVGDPNACRYTDIKICRHFDTLHSADVAMNMFV